MVVKKSSNKTVKKPTAKKRGAKPTERLKEIKNNSHEFDDRENQNVDAAGELALDAGERDRRSVKPVANTKKQETSTTTKTKKPTSKRKTIALESSSFKKAKQVRANKKHPCNNTSVTNHVSTCKESFDMHLASLKNKYAGWCSKHPEGCYLIDSTHHLVLHEYMYRKWAFCLAWRDENVTEDKPPQRNTMPEFWICCAEES
ncbi:12507_t:CDS:2 [Ambispora gerdemannii]|uniref:12507_t:CDS:1 n=1 Tax=Ambispora gerdemannii TaxID=144530 RepID=A0A9N9G018_9GLOM|nr:12507_t:CDS:2 [Ambispora gerdemannii]